MSKHDKPTDAPPAYPPPMHQDAGPAHPHYNNGFSSSPPQAHLNPRAGPGYGSPAPGGFQSPSPYGPPQPQQGYYGPPQGYQGPPQGMYYQQGGPGGPPGPYGPGGPGMYGPPGPGYRPHGGQYEQDKKSRDGICAGIFGALACCCCLDILF